MLCKKAIRFIVKLLFDLLFILNFPQLLAYICSKGCFAALIFRGAYFWRGLLLEGVFAFQNGFIGLDNKNGLKQLALTTHGLIFGRAYYRKDIFV